MLKRLIAASCLCLGLASVVMPARADDKKDIAAVFARLEKAMVAKDIKGIQSTATSDMTYTENGRTMTAAQVSAQMQQQFQMITGKVKNKFTITSLKISGKTATAVVANDAEMQVPGQDGKAHVAKVVGSSTNTLVKTPSGWLIKKIVITSNKMTLDGKAVNQPGAPAKKSH